MGRISLALEQINEQTPIGSVFGYLQTTSLPIPKMESDKRRLYVDAICKCGTIGRYRLYEMKRGRTNSCGCLQKERIVTTHKLTNHPLYTVWICMKGRCYNQTNSGFKYYGKRGIKVSDEWKFNFISFYDWCMVNGWEKGLEVDRINNDGNYEQSNCRITTHKINCNNKRNSKKQPVYD